jgi:hypothetical protein
VQEASRHYPDTWLYTDDDGARLLVDGLGLPFAHVCTDLNALAHYDPGWWALGKLSTYRLQTAPFVHLDADVFLWLPLPERLAYAAVFAQNPEAFTPGASYYQPERIERALAGVQGWLPDEWTWYRAERRVLRGECCGLFGGNHLNFIHHVADLAFKIIERRANRAALAALGDKVQLMLLLEQFLLAACVEYHRIRLNSPFRGVTIAYLFDSGMNLFHPEHAARAGYTHLLSGTKRNPAVAKLLEERLRRDDPVQFERCLRVAQGRSASRRHSVE